MSDELETLINDFEAIDKLRCTEIVTSHPLYRGLPVQTILRHLRELQRLRAALPKMADGMTVIPGMVVYLPDQDEEDYVDGIASCTAYMQTPEIDGIHWDFGDFYSTREAAERARGK